MECYVLGYHVYQRIWNPFMGEVVIAVQEECNTHDRYAVAILEEDTCCSVGHLPHEISKDCFFFYWAAQTEWPTSGRAWDPMHSDTRAQGGQ